MSHNVANLIQNFKDKRTRNISISICTSTFKLIHSCVQVQLDDHFEMSWCKKMWWWKAKKILRRLMAKFKEDWKVESIDNGF